MVMFVILLKDGVESVIDRAMVWFLRCCFLKSLGILPCSVKPRSGIWYHR